jgi:hypothetical protein
MNPTYGEAEIDPPRPAIEITDQTFTLVIPTSAALAAGAAEAGFFPAAGAEAPTTGPLQKSSSDGHEEKIQGTGRHPGCVPARAPKGVDEASQEFASCNKA